jgi:alpha-glucosidase
MENADIPEHLLQDPARTFARGRDPERTPMQWDGSPYAGFSKVEPWLPVSDDYSIVNVEAATGDPTSILTLYRRLLKLRQAHPALAIGDYVPVAMTGDLLAYIRRASDARFLVALNLGEGPYALSLSSLSATGRTVLSTYLDREDAAPSDTISLRANEGVIIALPARTTISGTRTPSSTACRSRRSWTRTATASAISRV